MAKQKQVTIEGQEFLLQHPGVRWYMNLTDRCRSNQFGVLMQEKYHDELLGSVVVKPDNVNSLDNFGPDKDYSGSILMELVKEIESFLES